MRVSYGIIHVTDENSRSTITVVTTSGRASTAYHREALGTQSLLSFGSLLGNKLPSLPMILMANQDSQCEADLW
jgi:hypothetical protein